MRVRQRLQPIEQKCIKCKNWIQIKKTVYEGGSEIINWSSSGPDNGHCNILEIETKLNFGCTRFEVGGHEEITYKTGEPWQHYVLITCPDCNGRGSDSQRHCSRCVGTGIVPKHDDGYISDQHTRKHPNDKKEAKEEPESGFVLKQSVSAKESIV